jgi:dual specificity phosphatase 3
MAPPMTDHFDIAHWHHRLCPVTDEIVVSGDLHEDPKRAAHQLEQWRQSGITHVLDTRSEWSDKGLVAKHAPDLVYGWVGTDDDGSPQPDVWFDDGLGFAAEALREPDSVLLVHCHMGINRGPSMAYRILLERGWDPICALDAIRGARPIADIGYAGDALGHYHRNHSVAASQRVLDRDRLEAWRRGYPSTGLHLTRPND